ncbi:MAG: dTDP-4-amino-4,6-dideoxygalactose transaminase [Proteobacteria bacterium]|nr:dTDP-4-amino-4,6-dideoxygalactose transaminase [Pseudomonadota bacterium]
MKQASNLDLIPFTKIALSGKEGPYLQETLKSGHWQGDGPMTKICESQLENLTKSHRVLLTSSGTDALELSALLIGIQPGDEVIMPSFTFVSSANAVVLRGGIPVFVDIRSDTLNLDERLIESAVTPKTRAIMPVHYAGFACDMDVIMGIARQHSLKVIEDAAHGAGAYWRGRHVGSIGDLGMLSFHQTKNIASGEGGALLINGLDLVEKAEIQREKGTNRRKFLRGEIDKYTWVDVGSSFLPSDLTAAVLRAQLEEMPRFNLQRMKAYRKYAEGFRGLANRECLALPVEPKDTVGNGHKFFVITKTPEERNKLRQYLWERGIQAVSHYEPLHQAPAGVRYGRQHGDLSVTESSAARILRLPLFADISETQQDRVIEAVSSYYLCN